MNYVIARLKRLQQTCAEGRIKDALQLEIERLERGLSTEQMLDSIENLLGIGGNDSE